MYVDPLEESIFEELKIADEIWMAVGLISKSGLPYIDACKTAVHIMVGIDLPTPPVVLLDLLNRSRKGKMEFKVLSIKGRFFHPKLYVWRKGNKYKAYVGSGNLTKGGWESNIELFWPVDDWQECKRLIRWFEVYMGQAIIIDERYIADYEARLFKPGEKARKEQLQRLDDFKESYESDYDQFFRQEDFEAFSPERSVDEGIIAKEARREVNTKLYELDRRLYPLIQAKGWQLYPHHRRANRVSHFAHNSHVNAALDGMWLYYGKSDNEVLTLNKSNLVKPSMNNHVRLQVIIRHKTVGVWCAVGKGGGSKEDRLAFYQKMQDKYEQQAFFSLIKNLGGDYFIDIAGRVEPYYVRDINTMTELNNIVLQDHEHPDEYFIIGIDLQPQDRRLSDSKIISFVMEEFQKLYPLFLFFKAHP